MLPVGLKEVGRCFGVPPPLWWMRGIVYTLVVVVRLCAVAVLLSERRCLAYEGLAHEGVAIVV